MNFLKMYKVEQTQFLRNPDVIIFNLAMPVVALFLISIIGGKNAAGEMGLTYISSSFVALTTVGICCSAFMSIPISLVEARDKGILRRMYCSPCSPTRLLACDTISSGVMAIISTLILTVCAVVAFGYRMQGNVLIFIGVWLLTLISMFSIGLMIASVCRTVKSMNVATSIVYFPMLLFSGATIPAEVFPEGMRFISDVLPLGVGINALKKVSIGVYDGLLVPALILAGIAVVCTIISIKTFRWE